MPDGRQQIKKDQQVSTVTVVGTGALGSSWVALLLSLGLEVVACDKADPLGQALIPTVTRMLKDLECSLDPDHLRIEADLAVASAMADLVIESGPERLDIKREIISTIDLNSEPTVLIASSSSGLIPSSFGDAASHPERVLVAHPFNPPHLIPLVEVVGGELTSEAATRAAISTLRHWGRTPVLLQAETPGHVVNRLQAALWREAYDLIGKGIISVGDLDLAVSNGPGLRWALAGPIATQHLSGGAGGLSHVLAHLGPPMVEWWQDLGNPTLTENLIATLVNGVREEVGGEEEKLVAARDQALVQLIRMKRDFGLDSKAGSHE